MAGQEKTGTGGIRPAGTVAVRCDILIACRDDLRRMAADKGVSMSTYVRQLVEKDVDAWRNNQNRGK